MIGRLFSIYKAGKFIYEFYQGLKKDSEQFEQEEQKLRKRKTTKYVTGSKKSKRKSKSKRNTERL
jgi:hypothetical protein